MDSLSKGYKQAFDNIWNRMANFFSDFRAKNRVFRPKKNSLLSSNHFLLMTRKSCAHKKVLFSQINISLLAVSGVCFLKKTDFWQKKHFSANLKMTVSPKFRPGPVLLSLWVIFLMARTVPPSFVDQDPKLRVLILAKKEWLKMAKKRGEPRKMTHYSETEIFFGVVQLGKLLPWVTW